MNSDISQYIIRHNQQKDRQLKYDFMPQLLELIERPAHIGGKIIIYSIFILLITAIVWASVAEIDIVVTAPGTVNPVGDVCAVQAQSTGTVAEISVREGDYVEANQVLIKLNGEDISAEIALLQISMQQTQAQLELYDKIADGIDITEYSLSEYSDEILPYVQTIIEEEKGYKNDLNSLRIQKETAVLNLELENNKLQQYQEMGLTAQIQNQELTVQQQNASITQIDNSIEKCRSTRKAEVAQKAAALLSTLQETEAKLAAYNTAEKSLSITAPVSGYINQLTVKNTGSLVTQAQEIVQIIPQNESNEITCYVQNMDIADIAVGDTVSIKLSAYPYSRFGTVNGEITYISPGAFADENMGSVYVVKAVLQNNNPNIQVLAGLTGTVEIKTGTRSVLSYFLEPITAGLQDSLKEK